MKRRIIAVTAALALMAATAVPALAEHNQSPVSEEEICNLVTSLGAPIVCPE